jgi:hypothetical protein
MKTGGLNILILFLVLNGRPSGAQECASAANIYSFGYDGKSYEIVKEKKNWIASAACALERGGHLVHLDDADEQTAVYDAIVHGAGIPVNYVSVPDGGGIAYIWIGATDRSAEGTWIWDGKNSGTGTNFWNGQGANGAGNGTAVGGLFNNWGGSSTSVPKEPDDFNSNQDGAAIGLREWPSGSGTLGVAGEWNDIAITNNLYFIIEYDPTGIPDRGQEKFKFTPNPVKNLLTVTSVQQNLPFTEIRILTGDGKEATRLIIPPSQTHTIDLSGFPAGNYMAGVGYQSGKWYYHLIIKQ